MTRRLGGHVSTAGGLINAVTNTLAIGGNCIQIFAGSPRIWARSLWPAGITDPFKQTVSQNDLNPVYIHALYLTNLASSVPELVTKSKSALITDMTNSAEIGSAGVILHIGSHMGQGWPAVRELVIANITEVLDSTPESSYLILENSAGQNGKIGSLSELSSILSRLSSDRLKICLDTAHAFEAGYNLASEAGLDMWIKDIDKYVGNRLDVLHLNDSKTPLGSGHDQHQNIGDGYIGTDGLRRLVNHPRFADLPLILEVPGLDGTGPDKANIDRVKLLLA